VASKFAWISGKRGFLIAIAIVAAALLGVDHHHFAPVGLWDGPG